MCQLKSTNTTTMLYNRNNANTVQQQKEHMKTVVDGIVVVSNPADHGHPLFGPMAVVEFACISNVIYVFPER